MILKLAFFLVLNLILLHRSVQCARILGVFPYAGRSHYILGSSLMKGLAEAGHDIVMVSPYEDDDLPNNGTFRNIVLNGFVEKFHEMVTERNFFDNNPLSAAHMKDFRQMLFTITADTFNHTKVKTLLDSHEKLDAIVVQEYFSDALSILTYHFDAPLIWLCPMGPLPVINDIFGNPSPLSYVPYLLSDYPPNMSFLQRLYNVLYYLYDHIVIDPYITEKNKELLESHPPNFNDLYYNASLVLLSAHESLTQAIPLTPNMIQIGGYHIKPPKKLPKDLQEYLDEAKDGVIYFSMGANLKSKDLPPVKRDALLRAFGKLKQRVLWKWEEDVLPGQPSNVKIGKWFPQQDILAHPNVKVFITHGGLLSTTESIYHGVPILAIPVFADQNINAKSAERNEYGLCLPYKDPTFSEETISFLLNELLYNPKYRDNAKERSSIFHDRPLKPMEHAVFWIEYVIRHKGAPHLKVAGIGMPWYRYYLVDVIALLAIVTLLVLFLLYTGVRYLLGGEKITAHKEKTK